MPAPNSCGDVEMADGEEEEEERGEAVLEKHDVSCSPLYKPRPMLCKEEDSLLWLLKWPPNWQLKWSALAPLLLAASSSRLVW